MNYGGRGILIRVYSDTDTFIKFDQGNTRGCYRISSSPLHRSPILIRRVFTHVHFFSFLPFFLFSTSLIQGKIGQAFMTVDRSYRKIICLNSIFASEKYCWEISRFNLQSRLVCLYDRIRLVGNKWAARAYQFFLRCCSRVGFKTAPGIENKVKHKKENILQRISSSDFHISIT